MEILLNSSQIGLFRKIIALFRQLSHSVYLSSTDTGLELSALNSSNTAWLHVFFPPSFFDSYTSISKSSQKEFTGLISSKNFYNSLSFVSLPRFHTILDPDNYFVKNNSKHLPGLDTCIISSENESGTVSFSLQLFNGLACRTTSVSYQNSPLQFPDSIEWNEYNYFRFQPQIVLRCINPYCFAEDDIIWATNPEFNTIEIKFLSKEGILNKQLQTLEGGDVSCGHIVLDSSQFDEISLVKKTEFIYSIFSIKQLAAVANLSDSLNLPLALVFKNPGDPAFALFGKAAYVPSNTFNPQAHILSSSTSISTYNRQTDYWSGSLWMSTIASEYFKQSSNESRFISNNIRKEGSRLSIPHRISITPPQSQLFNSNALISTVSVEPGESIVYQPKLFESQSPLLSPSKLELNDKLTENQDDLNPNELAIVFFNEFQKDKINKSPISLDQFKGEYIDTDGSISDFEVQEHNLDEFSKLACLWD